MIKFFAFLGFFSILTVKMVQASVPQSIGVYDDWSAYYYKDGKNVVCYMASTPKKDEGKYTKRGDIFTVITHRPNEKSFDVINVNAGYTYLPSSKVKIQIGNKTIDKLFTDGDKAWAISDKIDAEIVAEMKRGTRMIISGTSSKNTTTKDTYSLKGFGKAYLAINKKCGKK